MNPQELLQKIPELQRNTLAQEEYTTHFNALKERVGVHNQELKDVLLAF